MKYLLTIQYEFEADDDPSARKQAEFLSGLCPETTSAVKQKKLRCIYEDKAPRTLDFK